MTYDEIVDRYSGWNVINNTPGREEITSAAAVVCAKEARKQVALLAQLLNRLDALGTDGIHGLIQWEALRVRKARRLRQQKITAKRRRTRERNRLAAARAAK